MGVGLAGEGMEHPPPLSHASPVERFSLEHPHRPAASILMGEAVCGDADPPVLPSPPEVSVPAGGSSDQGTAMKKTGFMPSRALAGPQSKKLIPG